MGLLASDVAANLHHPEAAGAGPRFDGIDERPPGPLAPVGRIHHQADDLAPGIGLEDAVLAGVNPADRFTRGRYGDAEAVVGPSEQAREPGGDDAGAGRVAEVGAEGRKPGRVFSEGRADRQLSLMNLPSGLASSSSLNGRNARNEPSSMAPTTRITPPG
jgi:hypothetical protein